MGWTTPRTWVTGEVPTAGQFNTHVRDNLDYLYDGRPVCIATRGSNLSIPSGSDTLVTLPSDVYDPYGMHDTGSNTERIVVPEDGIYQVSGYLSWASEPGNSGNVQLLPNGGGTLSICGSQFGSVSALVQLSATNYVYLSAFQSTGSAINVVGRLSLVRVQ